MEFVYPILIFVVMGIVFGVLLVVISKVFAVKTDERYLFGIFEVL